MPACAAGDLGNDVTPSVSLSGTNRTAGGAELEIDETEISEADGRYGAGQERAVGAEGFSAEGKQGRSACWLACVEGLPRWLWAVTLLWVGVLAAWACWVQAQTGGGADGGPAGRGMSSRERLVFLLLLVPPPAVFVAAFLRA